MAAPPVVLVVPPRPAITNPTTISPTQFAFTIPADPNPSSITLFLTPNTTLPLDILGGIYIQLPWTPAGASFQLLGALSNEAPSATFALPEREKSSSANGIDGTTEEDTMTDAGPTTPADQNTGTITIGISLEPAATLLPQLSTLPSQQLSSRSSLALTRPTPDQTSTVRNPEATKILAQKIIGNAFNFLASFSGTAGPGGEEVVPLKSFRDWWTKFEKKVVMDPGFLEREVDS